MKKPILFLALLLSCLFLTACAQDQCDGLLPESEETITCRVVTVQEDQLLLAKEDGRATDVYTLTLGETPVTYADAKQTAIQPGDLVQIGYNGAIVETYPAQLGSVEAIQVQPTGQDDLCALYLQVLSDLWEVDDALNSDITQLGLDLSQTRLSPAQQGAVALALGQQRGLPVVEGTWEELADQGYIDREELYWKDGLFFSITEGDAAGSADEEEVTFTAQKWRSGLGAYLFTDCTAQRSPNASWGTYTVGAEAIS